VTAVERQQHKMGCVRANAGQGWRMDSSGRLSRLLNGSGGTCEREGAGGARPRGAVGRRESAHRTAGVVRAGRVPRVAGVAGIKACSLRRPSGVQSGGASARDPRRPTGKPRANPGKPRALIGLTKTRHIKQGISEEFLFCAGPGLAVGGIATSLRVPPVVRLGRLERRGGEQGTRL